MILRLIQYLPRDLFSSEIIAVEPTSSPIDGRIRAGFPMRVLGKAHVRQAVFPLARLLRHDPPDVLFSVQDHVNLVALLARTLSGKDMKTVISVRTTPSMALGADSNIKNRVLIPMLMRVLYSSADRVVALSQGVADDVASLAAVPARQIEVIYNPIVHENLDSLSREQVEHPWFSTTTPVLVSVGRLSPEKGYSYLLEAVKKVLSKRHVRLVLVGEGPQRLELEEQVSRLGITDSVALIGYRANPYKYMAKADVFVLSSLWEGLPAVIPEAMACGTPVVATDCPSGPAEIITRESEGLLVPPTDSDALADAILRVLSDRKLRKKMRAAGRTRAQAFRAEKVAADYEQLFLQILEGTDADGMRADCS